MTAFFCINVWLIPSPDGDIGFNLNYGDDEGCGFHVFPSPDGDIGFNLPTLNKDPSFCDFKFPSPDGDIGFNQWLLKNLVTNLSN